MKCKMSRLVAMAFVMLACTARLRAADDKGPGTFYGAPSAAGLGAGLTLIGAGYGFGRIGDGRPGEHGPPAGGRQQRQHEHADHRRPASKGATFFSLIVCIIMALKA